MQNPRLAAVYAKSLADLAEERKQFDQVYQDMEYIKAICAVSRELVVLLKSPVVYADKKQSILTAITKDNISDLTAAFNTLLIKKGREGYLPEIANAFINLYNERNSIHQVKVTTAEPLSDALRDSLEQKLKKDAGFEHVKMEAVVDADIIGGFILEYNNNLIDASILRDLQDVKRQFQRNDYVQNIR
ncbi:ATP synthase F1 subunit delta [Arachidicoccus ginsenosidivorans]|jgi:F-type H+-transporting ATPase subunit delta|uniref:ATP synthase subunit delta n=1 Tax=Arachidicoccus ginsenosidivorans TaxID=496057 RepID=A0A5B8VHU4_9BACT|nr:ATP synthase F1 subunit delta [Arachidicoccus ginsenosidivorans]QEC71060.1 ATP synthase F1 subunit delta [Arachidicoccus ginsenosidivorans]